MSGNSPGVLAHELTHSQLGTKSKSKLVNAYRTSTRSGLTRKVGRGVGAVGALQSAFGKGDGHEGTYLGLAGQAPTLVEEARANIKGYKALKNVGHSKQGLKAARKVLGRSMGSYLTVAAASAGINEMLRGGKLTFRNRKKWVAENRAALKAKNK